jgi:type I restriction enzyme S subunit
MASYFKGKLPSSILEIPIENSIPYLLVEAFEQNQSLYTDNLSLPRVTETDIVVVADGSRSGFPLRGKTGALGSTLLCYQPVEGVDSNFLFYLFQSLYGFTNTATIGGAVPHLDKRLLDMLELYVPLPDEQHLIGQCLVIIDQAISATETRLTASRRVKTALMQQLFTRGLPGQHRNFKRSVVFRHEFDVPENWDVDRLGKSVVLTEYGSNAPSNDLRIGFPIITIPEVVASRFQLGKCSYADVSEGEALALKLQPDDVLLIRTNGNPEYIGKSTVIGEIAVEQHLIYASYLIRVRTDGAKLSGRYLNYFLASPLGRRQCHAMANTSAGNHNLGTRSIRQFILPRPEPREQDEIVKLIDAAEDSIAAISAEIEKLQRLKKSLLQNLLTGKVRLKSE